MYDFRHWCQLSSAGIWFLMFLYIIVIDFLKDCKHKTLFTSTEYSASMEICGLQHLGCSWLNVHRGNSAQFFSAGSLVAHIILYFHKTLYFTIWHEVTVFYEPLEIVPFCLQTWFAVKQILSRHPMLILILYTLNLLFHSVFLHWF